MAETLSIAKFRASIPPIMSGIKTGGDGMRVQFDIPESDIGEAVKLLAMRGQRLFVIVEIENSARDWASFDTDFDAS
jgi:hypothetical protein